MIEAFHYNTKSSFSQNWQRFISVCQMISFQNPIGSSNCSECLKLTLLQCQSGCSRKIAQLSSIFLGEWHKALPAICLRKAFWTERWFATVCILIVTRHLFFSQRFCLSCPNKINLRMILDFVFLKGKQEIFMDFISHFGSNRLFLNLNDFI